MTIERAMWQSFGRRVDDMSVLEYETKLVMLQAEADAQRRERKR